ncbi:hypothetical protein FPQ18DRAFT_387082 [Pyronema domesticum]|nr:hypothetical protein FPQ18DRAFT_387082 [Pyronema domesticum]
MSPTTPITSSKHGMTLCDRSTPKPKPAGITSTADNESNEASKPSKVAKNTKNNKASKNNKAKKPKKIMARYIFRPKALQKTLQLFNNKSNAQFVDGYLKRLGEELNVPEKGIEITVSVSEGFEFLGWTKGMIFRDTKFAAEIGMELDDGGFKMKWNYLE